MKQKKYYFVTVSFLIFIFIFIVSIFSIGNYVLEQQNSSKEAYYAEEESQPLETKVRVEEEAVDRFFLSEVVNIDNRYVPMVHSCLFNRNGDPLFPLYIYNHFSSLSYPEKPPYEVVLIRYRVLPEDDFLFRPDKKCYIEEIKSEEDWTRLEKQYNFSKDLFI